MKITDLNIRIKFQIKEVKVDGIGQEIESFKDYHLTYAYPSYEGVNEKVFTGMEIDKSKISFTTRYQRKLDKVDTEKYRIVFRNEIYNIVSIDHMNYKNKYLKFRCEKVER